MCIRDRHYVQLFFFFNDTATTEIYTEQIVGSVRCVQETGNRDGNRYGNRYGNRDGNRDVAIDMAIGMVTEIAIEKIIEEEVSEAEMLGKILIKIEEETEEELDMKKEDLKEGMTKRLDKKEILELVIIELEEYRSLEELIEPEEVIHPDVVEQGIEEGRKKSLLVDFDFNISRCVNLPLLQQRYGDNSVSYTHLTLPTIYSVQISVVAVSLKKKNN
eukprot:TRINITY_DN865_c0_g1_i20.p1 TRINITY_DN865_c0_g1~~TRINITY_DN865_c0_g1_i20.p1  ORF type:complete len:217 (+),score=87.60 TRINITY_DN865_c0_g1_i20:82-732(+)